MNDLRTSPAGQAFIKSFESCSLTAYRDQGGTWTIGWGCTHGVGPAMIITQEHADSNFLADVGITEDLLSQCLGSAAPTLTANQWDALVSFCFNIGFGRKAGTAGPNDPGKDGFRVLRSGEPSTMLRCLLGGDLSGAAGEFPKWDHVAGVPNAGLLRRRTAEQALFLKSA